MSPARGMRSDSHVAGTHGWLPIKLGGGASGEAAIDGYNLHSGVHCGAPTTCRLYPFGATHNNHHHHRVIKLVFSMFPRISLLYLLSDRTYKSHLLRSTAISVSVPGYM